MIIDWKVKVEMDILPLKNNVKENNTFIQITSNGVTLLMQDVRDNKVVLIPKNLLEHIGRPELLWVS